MELTDAGRAALKAGQQANAEAELALLSGLSPQHTQIRRRALRTIVLPPAGAGKEPE
ncbi:hypothetical protein GCM10022223_34120 [Kineosporia mesophila]|uniref:MarR family transcriptional regulator n=1 Tax=Kineosporia mesophila TaxID=566012 RepID=A0ABP6ZPD4_9ACTN|nr:hypothetical protein [Kineosporia mesophila]MCD5354717.1 hypothetical protein [Kineosporia mesophila]